MRWASVGGGGWVLTSGNTGNPRRGRKAVSQSLRSAAASWGADRAWRGGEDGITRTRPADFLGRGFVGSPAAAEWLSTCSCDSFGPPAGSKGWWMWSPSSPLQSDLALQHAAFVTVAPWQVRDL